MTKGKSLIIWLAVFAFNCLCNNLVMSNESKSPTENTKPTAARPALNVTIIQPTNVEMPKLLTANGSIAAWQEAIVGAQISNLRLDEVRVQVGETVRKGQVLAVFDNKPILAEVAKSRAALAEAEASLEEARLNANRAREIAPTGALSKQVVVQYLTAEKTAKAKLESAKAMLDTQLLRLSHTQVIAMDDGVISSRTATLGAVVGTEQELFRLIRQNRLEWRAEVTAAEMAQLKPGAEALVSVPNVDQVKGKLRSLAPSLDTQSRNGLVYVDLPNAAESGLRAGMFAQGEFNLGSKSAWTIPQAALSLREGFSYVFVLHDLAQDQAKISQVKVQLGSRSGDSYEVLSGLKPEDKLVASGAAFLADGDTVRLVSQ